MKLSREIKVYAYDMLSITVPILFYTVSIKVPTINSRRRSSVTYSHGTFVSSLYNL